MLTGTEVKSVRTGKTNLKDAYGLLKDGELWLLNCHISPYEHGNYSNHAVLRTRKLLVHKEELRKLMGKTQQKGLTLIPTRMYFKNGKIKVELALAKGKRPSAVAPPTRKPARPSPEEGKRRDSRPRLSRPRSSPPRSLSDAQIIAVCASKNVSQNRYFGYLLALPWARSIVVCLQRKGSRWPQH